MVGQREENGKGAQPLLMQIAATLKESREARKVLFNVVADNRKGDLINKEERRDRQSFEHKILLLYPPCALV